MAQSQAEIECCIVGETDKAYRITTDGKNSFWVPKSQILDDDLPADNYCGTGEIFHIYLPQWLAEEKGLV